MLDTPFGMDYPTYTPTEGGIKMGRKKTLGESLDSITQKDHTEHDQTGKEQPK